MVVPPVSSKRLDLVWMSPEFMTALLEGRRLEAEAMLAAKIPADWPGDDERDVRLLRIRLQDMNVDPSTRPWLLRAIVLRQPHRAMVGHVGFHWKPDEHGAVEIGYAAFPKYRRQGYAIEAIRGMSGWAKREHGIGRIVASVAPENEPSLRLLERLGFQQTGTHWDDEDGEELVFELGL
jgi:ribosomal-protein-alanine N-acetyltransferase